MNHVRRATLACLISIATTGAIGCAAADDADPESFSTASEAISTKPLLPVGEVCKMEWVGKDPLGARTFYGTLFPKWTFFTPFEHEGRVFTPWEDGPGPGGDCYMPPDPLEMPPDPIDSAWRPHVRVAHLPAALSQAKSLGASILLPTTPYGRNGDTFAVIKDPAGSVIGLWASPTASYEGGELDVNAFYHMRLYTPDVAKAKSFYAALFPQWKWAAPVTISGRVFVPWDGGPGPGGDIVKPTASEVAGWHGFVRVGQLETAIQTATRNGGRMVTPPTVHGTWGRYAMVTDPGHARIGLWEK